MGLLQLFWMIRWGIFKWPQVGDFGWPSGFYFITLKHDNFSDIYKQYMESCIESFIEGSKLNEKSNSYRIGGVDFVDHAYNLVLINYENINEPKLTSDLSDAIVSVQ
jgi:hypothetical protein